MITHVTNAVRGRHTINPKTVLGFYATVLGLMLLGSVSAVGVLSSSRVEIWLIPWLLGFSAILFVLLVAGVFVVSLIDPSKLMLTQVSGTEYAAIQQQLILGDSSRGDRVEVLPVVESLSLTSSQVPGVEIAGEIEGSTPGGSEMTGTTETKK